MVDYRDAPVASLRGVWRVVTTVGAALLAATVLVSPAAAHAGSAGKSSAGPTFDAIVSGSWYNCALDDGAVYCWGSDAGPRPARLSDIHNQSVEPASSPASGAIG